MSWQQLVLMLADAPRYIKHKKKSKNDLNPNAKQGTALTIFQALQNEQPQ